MKCPQCVSEMEAGIAVVKAKPGWLSMFAGTNGFQHLWFVNLPTMGGSEVAALEENGMIPKRQESLSSVEESL
jgi:hypothetical protein